MAPSSSLRALHGATLLAALVGAAAALAAPALTSAPVDVIDASGQEAYDGVVQAVRQTVVAAQVAGAVVGVTVKAGDRVHAGQLLLRLDARAAEQAAAAGAAQVQAARAAQEAATKEFERQQLLFQQHYISQAALERAEAQFKSAQAESAAQLASAGAVRTQSGFYSVHAPYAGVVADVAVVLGDMALPGRPLLTVYDPAALRVSVAVPQTLAARASASASPQVALPGASPGRIQAVRAQWLPTADPATHTLELRLDLPPGLPGVVAPGMSARVWLPDAGGAMPRLSVPARAVVRRAELTAVYAIAADGKPLLRQVRLGRGDGERVEVLAGLSAGERVALDPQQAARWRAGTAP